MTTREDFELAAKAAGYTFDGQTLRNPNSDFEYDGWNPVTDDGDAFRLMVACGLSGAPEHVLDFVAALGDADPLAATRLAVFRAAVEIGMGMP